MSLNNGNVPLHGIAKQQDIYDAFVQGFSIPHKILLTEIKAIYGNNPSLRQPLIEYTKDYEQSLDGAGKLSYGAGCLASAPLITSAAPIVALLAMAYGSARKAQRFVKSFNPEAVAFAISADPSYFVPHRMTASIADLDFEKYAEKGVEAVVLDAEGTLMSGNSSKVHDDLIASYAKGIDLYGPKKFVILSNNAGSRKDRSGLSHQIANSIYDQLLSRGLRLPEKPVIVEHRGLKPGYIPEVEDTTGVALENTLVVGDYGLTDIAFGNRFGSYTVQVVEFPGHVDDGKLSYDNHAIRARKSAVASLRLMKLGIKPVHVQLQDNGVDELIGDYASNAMQKLESRRRMLMRKHALFIDPAWAKDEVSWISKLPSGTEHDAGIYIVNRDLFRRAQEKLEGIASGLAVQFNSL